MASSAMEHQLGYSGNSRLRTRRQTQTKYVHNHHAHTCAILTHCAAFYTHVYLHAKTTGDVGDMRTNHCYFDHVMSRIPPIGTPCWEENGASSWISSLYPWLHYCLYNVELAMILICVLIGALSKLVCKLNPAEHDVYKHAKCSTSVHT